MKKVPFETLAKLATEEVKKLKKHATKEEIDRLSIDNFNPDSMSRCIYGQLTGNCTSKRAEDLITSCCKKVLNVYNKENIFLKCSLNGKPKKLANYWDRLHYYVSPIESLIYRRKRAGKRIINYLKGVTKHIDLTTL